MHKEIMKAVTQFLRYDAKRDPILNRTRVGREMMTRDNVADFIDVQLLLSTNSRSPKMDNDVADVARELAEQSFIYSTKPSLFGQPCSGSALEACIASLLGIPLSDVPVFYKPNISVDDYYAGFVNYVRSMGFFLLVVDASNLDFDCLHLAVCTIDDNEHHPVIMRKNTIIHDPNIDQVRTNMVVNYRMVVIPDNLRSWSNIRKLQTSQG